MSAQETLRQAFQLFEQEHYAAAEQALFDVLAHEPGNARALHLLGSVALAQSRPEEAALALQQALTVLSADAPETPAIRYKLGRAFHALARHEDAFLIFRDLIESGQPQPELFVAAATTLQALSPSGKNDAQAMALLDEALRRQPESVETADIWHRKARLQSRAGQWEAARESMRHALRLDGRHAQYWQDAGLIEHALGHFEDALPLFDQALIADPDLVDAHVSRGTALARLRQIDEAIDSYRRALRLHDGDAEARVNLALSLLVQGHFEEALPLYEWRWEGKDADPYRHSDIPAWNGATPLRGKRLLLWAEQGQGDTIQFSRYVRHMAQAGAQVVLEVPPSLHALMRSLPDAPALDIIATGDRLPQADVQLPLMSLPLVCNTTAERIPAPVPYLHADPARVAQWAARIDAMRQRAPETAPRLRVGIVCSGNAGNANDRRRSIPLATFAPLAQARPDADFFLLQPDPRQADAAWLAGQPADTAWHWLGADIQDFADTAAALANMDLLITVDTAAAHLAGALGLPVWIALPFAPDWRWFLNRSDSPWYPTARLFRQQQAEAGQWEEVILALKAALAVLL